MTTNSSRTPLFISVKPRLEVKAIYWIIFISFFFFLFALKMNCEGE